MTHALTIWQPWASLIMIGAKPFEFRSWPAQARFVGQRIVIHAANREIKRPMVEAILSNLESGRLDEAAARPFLEKMMTEFDKPMVCNCHLPSLGVGLGTVELGEPLRRDDFQPHTPLAPDMWAWPMLDPQPFAEPIEHRGSQRFWKWAPPGEQMREAG